METLKNDGNVDNFDTNGKDKELVNENNVWLPGPSEDDLSYEQKKRMSKIRNNARKSMTEFNRQFGETTGDALINSQILITKYVLEEILSHRLDSISKNVKEGKKFVEHNVPNVILLEQRLLEKVLNLQQQNEKLLQNLIDIKAKSETNNKLVHNYSNTIEKLRMKLDATSKENKRIKLENSNLKRENESLNTALVNESQRKMQTVLSLNKEMEHLRKVIKQQSE